MKDTTEELKSIVSSFARKCGQLSAAEFSSKPNPAKWSKKEVLGHLIDSGQNNLRRFICGQYESTPPKIVYDQDFWVKANDYQSMEQGEVIQLWILTNGRIAAILHGLPKSNYNRVVDTGKREANLKTIEWLAVDYVKHMKHHLNQIFPASFDVVYP